MPEKDNSELRGTEEGIPPAIPPEVSPNVYREQLAALTRKHQEALAELGKLKAQPLSLQPVLERLESLETEYRQERTERAVTQIREMMELGDADKAREGAIKLVKEKAKRLGIDAENDAKLAEIRKQEDPLELLESYNKMEQSLLEEKRAMAKVGVNPAEPPKPEATTPAGEITLGNISPGLRKQIEQEMLEKYGLLKIVTSQPSGGIEIEHLSPREKIRMGLQQ